MYFVYWKNWDVDVIGGYLLLCYWLFILSFSRVLVFYMFGCVSCYFYVLCVIVYVLLIFLCKEFCLWVLSSLLFELFRIRGRVWWSFGVLWVMKVWYCYLVFWVFWVVVGFIEVKKKINIVIVVFFIVFVE